MPTVESQRTIAGLRKLRIGIAEAAALTLKTAVEAAEQHAKSTTLWHDRRPEGGTRSSIKGTVAGLTGKLFAGGASRVLENGTVAHRITAVNALALRFYVNGQTVFRRSVWHPGTAPRPFLREAVNHGEIAASFAGEIYVNEAIARA